MAALIFDFDGVIADSEAISNSVLAEKLTEAGAPTTLEDSLARYCGRRWSDLQPLFERSLGRPLAPGFREAFHAATVARFEVELKEVAGASAYIAAFADLPRCIASSSSRARIDACLKAIGLEHAFGDHILSAETVARGKPFPDIFLAAAERLRTEPGHCLVIEDSAGGIQAAVAAGMTSIGLCGGSHIRSGHAETLTRAGADFVAQSWDEAAQFTHGFLAARP